MTPSQLSIIVKSQGVEKAAQDLDKLAKAAASVDSETKAFVIAQGKLAESNQKVGKSSEATARNISVQELAILKAHEAALKMNAAIDRQVAAQDKLNASVQMAARGVTQQELAMIKAHEQALKMNAAFDKQADSLKNVSHHGNIFNNTLRSMATAALAYMGVNFFAGIIKDADAWALMQSKLNLAVGSMELAKTVQKDLYEMSQKLRVPLEDTTKLFTRMSVPLQKMGKGVTDTKLVVESFSTALKLAGATGQEASSAMLQFSQSLNAGRLNGGEFNSIAEASPNVLRAIERELIRVGKGAELATKGLKKMAADGKITTDVLVEALQRAAPQWKKEFETLPLTVDGAMTRIKNAWQKAVGEMGQDTKFNQRLAEALGKLEDMLPSIAKAFGEFFIMMINHGEKLLSVITGIAVVMASFKIASLISAMQVGAAAINVATGAAMGFRGALLAIGLTPVGLFIAGLGVALGGLIMTFNHLTKQNDEVTESQKRLKAVVPSLVEQVTNENKSLDAQILALDKTAAAQDRLNKAKTEGLITGSQSRISAAMDAVQLSEINLMKSKKAWDEVKSKGNLGDSGLFRQYKEDLAIYEANSKAFAELQVKEVEQAKKNEIAKALLKKQAQDDYAEQVKKAAMTEKQIADSLRKEEIAAAKKALDEGIATKETYNQALLNAEKKYQDSLSKIKSSTPREVTPELTNLDKVNKLLSEQVELNKEWEQSANKKLSVGEKFRIQVEAENASIEKTLASGMLHNKILTEAEKRQARKTIEVNKEAIAISKIVEAQQKYREMEQADKSRIEKAEKTLEAEEQNLAILSRQLEVGEESKIARAQQSVIEAEIALSLLAQNNGMNEEFATAMKTLEVRKKTLDVMKNLEAKDAAEQEAKKYEDAYQAANKKIQDGLYNAIGKGGGDAIKKLIQDIKSWFARLILKPLIDPISKIGASIISPNAASAQGGITNLMEMGSTIYKSITTGFSAASAASAEAFTSFATSAFGEAIGLSSSAMAAEVAALTGSGTGAALTTAGSFGASAASMMPYVAAAVAAFQGVKAINGDYRLGGLSADAGALLGIAPRLFGMKEKQFAAQTVTGNLGTNDLTRNQAWTQSGGLFRSDRADTWRYRLSDSIATTGDGKSYQDTASMESDKALLNQLNTMYDAVKMASTEYAKALGINADSIKARTDAINFTFGKTAEETSANITKAFEDVTNLIARDLLGDLAQLSKVGETSAQTMGRLATNISATNGMFKALGYDLFQLNVSGIKAADGLVTLFGGLDKFQSIAADYYDKFYSESEKTQVKVNAMTKSLQDLGIELPTSRAAFRGLVEAAQKAGNNELYVSLMKLSSAFADITDEAQTAAKELPAAMKEAFESLSRDAQRWLSIRNQAAALKDEINVAMGNPKKDPAIRMQQLWDAMSKDVTPEQKLQLAGELKDLMLQKYQVEKDSLTRLIDFGKQLRGYVDSLKVGNLSPLTMGQKLAEAQAQYQATFAKAQGGDVAAQGMLQGKADTYLQLAQTALASSSEYSAIFSEVTNGLDSLGIESMSAAEQVNQTATEQLAELQRLSDFVGSVEVTANSYYNSSLTALASQINIMDAMYQKMGIFDGMLSSIAGLPAEIAAALSGKVGSSFGNDEFIRNLYQSVEGRVGSQIDSEGYNYWMKDLMTSTKEQVANNFVMASQENNINRNASNTSSLEAQVAALTAEVKGLREDQNAQTGALINTQLMTSETSTAAIVTATKESVKDESWQNSLKPELV